MYFIPLTDLTSVQLGSLSNYVDGLKSVSQVQGINELVSGHIRNLSDIWISFLTKIDSLITTRLVFLASCDTLNNTFIIFQYKSRFVIFHQELRHRRLGGITLARIHIIWGGHVLPCNFQPGLGKMNSHPLTQFLDPVA